jgi:hypothetical protein
MKTDAYTKYGSYYEADIKMKDNAEFDKTINKHEIYAQKTDQ